MRERGEGLGAAAIRRPATVRPARIALPVLPEGVSHSAWALERVRNQNPRIRGLLDAIRRLEEIGESPYYLSHCSLRELDRRADAVWQVIEALRARVLPHLGERSPVSALEEARAECLTGFEHLEADVIAELARLESLGRRRSDAAFRRSLGRVLGLLHGYVVDAYGRLMAADPRSDRNAEYFLSRRFAWHVEEAEVLYAAVFDLGEYLRSQGRLDSNAASALAEAVLRRDGPPTRACWQAASLWLHEVSTQLLPRLDELRVSRGIRFGETQVVDGLAESIALTRTRIEELQTLWLEERLVVPPAVGRVRGWLRPRRAARDRSPGALAHRLSRRLLEIERHYRDLREFVPLWLRSIEHRRALVLFAEPGPLGGGTDGPDRGRRPVAR